MIIKLKSSKMKNNLFQFSPTPISFHHHDSLVGVRVVVVKMKQPSVKVLLMHVLVEC
jgi:hypothetical protein